MLSINKYTPLEMINKVKATQLELLKADNSGHIIYQLDESIYDAR
jgi:hypothetical protein